jgi:transposase-like protein
MSTTHPIRRRRSYTAEFKQRLVALCQPGISVSAIALTHGLNANLLRRWINECQNELPVSAVSASSQLVAVQVDLPAEPSVRDAIEITLHKNNVHINIRWPVNQAQACASWLSAWLK